MSLNIRNSVYYIFMNVNIEYQTNRYRLISENVISFKRRVSLNNTKHIQLTRFTAFKTH